MTTITVSSTATGEIFCGITTYEMIPINAFMVGFTNLMQDCATLRKHSRLKRSVENGK
jgi:hypothetical protein